MRTKVYIAGPMTKGDRIDNLSEALKAFRRLQEEGYAPFCPQLSYFIDRIIELSHADWLNIDLPWLCAADAILRLPGASEGADKEVAYANLKGIPVYDDIAILIRELPCQNF